MRPILAVDCPVCGVSRETHLCGYTRDALNARLVLGPRLMECRVCGSRERRGLFDSLLGRPRSWRLGVRLTPAEVAARARDLLRADGLTEAEVDALRLVAAR